MQSLNRVKNATQFCPVPKPGAWSLPHHICYISVPSSLPEKIKVTKDILQGTYFLFLFEGQ